MTRDCPCFACQCEPNQVTKDAIREAREMTHHDDLLARIDYPCPTVQAIEKE